MNRTIVVWFREDLRLDDNPALFEACAKATHIIPVYIFDESDAQDWPMGSASRWWLDRSLLNLHRQLKNYQSDLLLFKGDSITVLEQIISTSNVDAIHWNRLYTPAKIKRDKQIKHSLQKRGIEAVSFAGNVLIEPWKTLNKSNLPYKVFTPFYNRIKDELITQLPSVYQTPDKFPPLPKTPIKSASLKSLGLYVSKVNWAKNFSNYWSPGEAGAHQVKDIFISDEINQYEKCRDLPNVDGTSKLSAHLHFGEVSVKALWIEIYQNMANRSPAKQQQMWSYLRQLVWRDFNGYLLFHFEHIDQAPFKEDFSEFPWVSDQQILSKWQQGKTGYPLVDAGMRQLWQTGWMHNRVRMVCASFLTKHLLIHWLEGAKWFWDTLIDADLANNSGGWQWVAGSGADATPYFRIFNPMTQSKKFDSKGDYLRQWLPELKELDNEFIHEPWLADDSTLKSAGLELGKDYPHMIIEHTKARQRALAAYTQIRK